MFFKVFIIEKTNEKFLLEAAYFFTKNYNTTSYNYRINRLLQIIPQIFFKSPTQKKYIMAAPSRVSRKPQIYSSQGASVERLGATQSP